MDLDKVGHTEVLKAIPLQPSIIMTGSIDDIELLVEWAMSTLFAAYKVKDEHRTSMSVGAEISEMALRSADSDGDIMQKKFVSEVLKKAVSIVL